MTSLIRTLAFLSTTLCFGSSALATQLNYNWKSGQTYRFQTTSVDKISMSGMGMNMQDTFTLNSTFAIHIDNVQANGTAEGVIAVEAFKVTNKAGQVMGSLSGLPKNALRNLVEIDRKGNFKFKEIVYMVVDEKGDNMLVSAKVGPNGGSASAQMGDEKVTVHASFDPKTGKLSGGYSVEKVKKPAANKKKVKVKKDAPKVDLLPTKFLELLKLPDGPVSPGASFNMTVGSTKIATSTPTVTAKSATLKTQIETGTGADGVGGMSGMGGGMGGMSDMGGGMGGMGAGAPEMKLNGAFESVFEVAKGMLKTLQGTISSDMKMGGMLNMKTTTNLTLKRL